MACDIFGYDEHFDESVKAGRQPLDLESWAALQGIDLTIIKTGVPIPAKVDLESVRFSIQTQPYREPS